MAVESLTLELGAADKRIIDGFVAQANKVNDEKKDEDGYVFITALDVIKSLVEDAGIKYADHYSYGVETSGEFVNRFTSDEIADIKTAVGANNTEVKNVVKAITKAHVIKFNDPLLAPALQKLVDEGVLTAQRKDDILNYSRPDFVDQA